MDAHPNEFPMANMASIEEKVKKASKDLNMDRIVLRIASEDWHLKS